MRQPGVSWNLARAEAAQGAVNDLLCRTEALWQAVQTQWPGFTVEVLPEIDSTNSELMRRARTGSLDPVLLVAERQTAGRGRMGKAWHSHVGQSLTFSLALPLAPRHWSGLSLAVGVSLAESLHPDVRLKWPNDLWLNGRKLGGVLVETAHAGGSDPMAQRLVVVGVGLNIARPRLEQVQTPAPVGGLAPVEPAGLAEVCVGQTAGETLANVVPPLVHDLGLFAREGFGVFQSRFQRRDALLGQGLRLSDGQTGVAAGVASDGALLMDTPNGRQTISSSEVSVRAC